MAQCVWCCSELSPTPYLRVTDRLQRFSGTFCFYLCQQCGSAVLNPRPTEEQAKSLYEDSYVFEQFPISSPGGLRLWNQLEWNLLYRRGYLRDVKHIRQFQGPGPLRLLDVGCGSGLRLKVFREEGIAAEGTEVSDRLLRYANERLGLPVRKMELEELEGLEERFDVVTLYSVLEHIPEPRLFLRVALRLIRSGGLLVVRVPMRNAFLARLLGARHIIYREAPRHVWIPSAPGFEDGVRAEGATMIARKPVGLLASAGYFSLSVYPSGSTPLASARRSPITYVLTRGVGGVFMIVGIPFGICESLAGMTSETDFFIRA